MYVVGSALCDLSTGDNGLANYCRSMAPFLSLKNTIRFRRPVVVSQHANGPKCGQALMTGAAVAAEKHDKKSFIYFPSYFRLYGRLSW